MQARIHLLLVARCLLRQIVTSLIADDQRTQDSPSYSTPLTQFISTTISANSRRKLFAPKHCTNTATMSNLLCPNRKNNGCKFRLWCAPGDTQPWTDIMAHFTQCLALQKCLSAPAITTEYSMLPPASSQPRSPALPMAPTSSTKSISTAAVEAQRLTGSTNSISTAAAEA